VPCIVIHGAVGSRGSFVASGFSPKYSDSREKRAENLRGCRWDFEGWDNGVERVAAILTSRLPVNQ